MVRVKSLEEMPESIRGAGQDERETIIRKDVLDGKAHICTTDYVEYGKLIRKCRANPGSWEAIGYEILDGEPQAAYFACPAKLVRYASESQRPELTEEQKKALAERMRGLRAIRDAKAAK